MFLLTFEVVKHPPYHLPKFTKKSHFRKSHQLCLLSTTVGWFVRPQRSPIFFRDMLAFSGMNRWKNLNFKCLKFQFSFYHHGKSKSNYPKATPDHGGQSSLNKALFVGVNVALGGVNVPYVPLDFPQFFVHYEIPRPGFSGYFPRCCHFAGTSWPWMSMRRSWRMVNAIPRTDL